MVLANPKTVLNDKYAKKEIKNQVIRADQLLSFIQSVNSEASAVNCSEDEMKGLAKYFLNKNTVNPVSYLDRYQEFITEDDFSESEEATEGKGEVCQTEHAESGSSPSPGLTEAGSSSSPEAIESAIPEQTAESAPVADETPDETPKETPGKPEDTPAVVLCPKCGAPMVRRKATKGANIGKEFYGCSMFPKCRGIINIQES